MISSLALHHRLGLAANICGLAAALLIYSETGSYRIAMAAMLGSLLICLLHHAHLAFLCAMDRANEPPMDHRKVILPEPRKTPGNRYTPRRVNGGFTLPQTLWCIGALLLAQVVVIALHFIVTTVMGMQEPKW